MRNISIILLILLFSCKSKVKTSQQAQQPYHIDTIYYKNGDTIRNVRHMHGNGHTIIVYMDTTEADPIWNKVDHIRVSGVCTNLTKHQLDLIFKADTTQRDK